MMYIHRASIFYQEGKLDEAKADCQRGLDVVDETEQPAVVAEGYSLLGSVYDRSGEHIIGISFMKEGLAIWENINNPYQVARVKDNIGTAYFHLGQINQAREFHLHGLEYWKTFSDKSPLALAFNNAGFMSYTLAQCLGMAGLSQDAEGHYQQAADYYHQAIEISQRLDLPRVLVLSNMNLAWLHIAHEDWDEAEHYIVKSQMIQNQTENEMSRIQAEVALGRKQFSQAIELAEKVLSESQNQGDKFEEGAAHRLLGQAYCLSGELDQAEKYLKTSLSQLQAINNPFEMALTLRELVLLYLEQERFAEVKEAETEVQAILVKMGIIESERE